MFGRTYGKNGSWNNEDTGNWKACFPVSRENRITKVSISTAFADSPSGLIDICSTTHDIRLIKYLGQYAIYEFDTDIFYGGEFELNSGSVGITFTINDCYWRNFPSKCIVRMKKGEYGHTTNLVDIHPPFDDWPLPKTTAETTKTDGGLIIPNPKKQELAKLQQQGKTLQKKIKGNNGGLFSGMFGNSKESQMKEALGIFQQICLLKKELGLKTAEFHYKEDNIDLENSSFDLENNTFNFSKKTGSSKEFSGRFNFESMDMDDDVIDI